MDTSVLRVAHESGAQTVMTFEEAAAEMEASGYWPPGRATEALRSGNQCVGRDAVYLLGGEPFASSPLEIEASLRTGTPAFPVEEGT